MDEDEKKAAGIKELIDETKKLTQSVTVMQQDHVKDLRDMKESIDTSNANRETIDKEKMEGIVNEIMEKQEEETVKNRVFTPFEQETLSLPDPWSAGAEFLMLDDIEPKDLIAKGTKGLDALITMPPLNDNQKNLQRFGDDVKLLDAIARSIHMLSGKQYGGFKEHFPKMSKKWGTYQKWYAGSVTKANTDAMDTTDTANWVPTGWSSEIRELITLKLKVAALFDRFTMPQSPFDLPIDLTDTVGDFLAESTVIAVAPTTTGVQILDDSKVTFTAAKLRARLITSSELVEDAAIAMLPLIRKRLVSILANSQEYALIDGQATAAIDTDPASPTGTDVRLAFDGIRYFCAKTADGAASDVSMVDFSTNFNTSLVVKSLGLEMGEFAADPSQQAIIPSIPLYLKMVCDATNFPEVLTMDKYGANATIVKGELARIAGIPVVPSRYVRTDLNATGFRTSATAPTFTVILRVNRDAFLIGDRRDISIEAERLLEFDQHHLVAFQRMYFRWLFGWTHKVAAVGFNIASA